MSANKIIAFGKEYPTIKSLSDEFNIDPKLVYGRLSNGWSAEEAVTRKAEISKQHSIQNFKNHNIPIEENEVRDRFKKCGYEIIEYTYKNNQTKMLCKDKDGYLVYASLTSVERYNNAQIFSISCNEDNFLYNARLYAKKHSYNCTVEGYNLNKYNNPNIVCKCNCGNCFQRNFNSWMRDKLDLCDECRRIISSYEQKVKNLLEECNIDFIFQKRFEDCRNEKPLPFDFYLPKYNCCIEVDGEQHFQKENDRMAKYNFSSKEKFEKRKHLDKIKTNYCESNNIDLIRIPYTYFKNNEYKNYLVQKLNLS